MYEARGTIGGQPARIVWEALESADGTVILGELDTDAEGYYAESCAAYVRDDGNSGGLYAAFTVGDDWLVLEIIEVPDEGAAREHLAKDRRDAADEQRELRDSHAA